MVVSSCEVYQLWLNFAPVSGLIAVLVSGVEVVIVLECQEQGQVLCDGEGVVEEN